VDPRARSIPATAPSRLSLWAPVVLYCLLIFALSSISTMPSAAANVSDKLAHTVLYGGLGLLVARGVSGGTRPLSWAWALVVVAFAGVYGLSDETHQLFVPMRQFDLKDIAADMLGGGLGAGAWWLWGILRGTRDAV
jgi:VanZ family protein